MVTSPSVQPFPSGAPQPNKNLDLSQWTSSWVVECTHTLCLVFLDGARCFLAQRHGVARLPGCHFCAACLACNTPIIPASVPGAAVKILPHWDCCSSLCGSAPANFAVFLARALDDWGKSCCHLHTTVVLWGTPTLPNLFAVTGNNFLGVVMHLDPWLGAPACTKLFFGLSRAAAEVPWVGPAVQPGPNAAHQLRGTSCLVQQKRSCPLGMPVLSLWCHRGPTCGILAATLENLRDGDLPQCSTIPFWCTPTQQKLGSVTMDKFLGG